MESLHTISPLPMEIMALSSRLLTYIQFEYFNKLYYHYGILVLREGSKMQTISLKLSDAMSRKLDIATHKKGISKSELLRTIIEDYLSHLNNKKNKVSFLELAEDLCGCVNGPSDLSVNQKYFEDFGK